MRIIIIGGGIIGSLTAKYISDYKFTNDLGEIIKPNITIVEKNKELGLGASGANASLLIFNPNFDIFSFSPDKKSIINTITNYPIWSLEYYYNYLFKRNNIKNRIHKLSDLSHKEFLNFNENKITIFPLYKNVFEEGKLLLKNAYLLNCREFLLSILNENKNIKVLTQTNAVEFIKSTQGNHINKLKIINKDGKENYIEGDIFILCNSGIKNKNNKLFYPYTVLPVHGISFIKNKTNKEIKYTKKDDIRADIYPNSSLVISNNTKEIRHSFGAYVFDPIKDTKETIEKEIMGKIPKKSSNFLYDDYIISARPTTSSGMPIIEKDKIIDNLYYNIGHGFMGGHGHLDQLK